MSGIPPITLISDSSLDVFPNNRIGSFRAKLPQTIRADKDRYRIGLSYISWPNKVYNVENGGITVKATGPPRRVTLAGPIVTNEGEGEGE